MTTIDDALKRECLELLVEQNPMLDKDSIIALYNDIENSSEDKTGQNIKHLIETHNY